MKSTIITLICCIAILNATAQTLSTAQQPAQGDTLKLVYNPKGGKLEHKTAITCTAIISADLNPVTININLQNENGLFRGSIITKADTRLVSIGFSADGLKDEKPDGYFIKMYKNNLPVEGAWYLLADFIQGGGMERLYGQATDYQKAIECLKNEIKTHPNGRYHNFSMINYYKFSTFVDRPAANKEIDEKIAALNAGEKVETDYILLFRLYELKNQFDKTQEVLDALQIAYPKSTMFFSKRFKDVQANNSAVVMEEEVNTLIADYNMEHNEELLFLIPSLHLSLAKAYLREQKFDKFYWYTAKHPDQAIILNWAAEYLLGKGIALEEATKISKQSIALIETGLTKAKKTNAEQKYLQQKLATFNSTLGQLMYATAQFGAALQYLEIAYKLNGGDDIKINTSYALAMVKNNLFKEAIPLLENAIKDGDISIAVQQAHRIAFLKNGGNNDNYETATSKLYATGRLKANKLLQKMDVNIPALPFSLKDLTGKTVSLADFKGKTVVLDFWATWCGPCKEAFPGMQKLINKYAANKNIVFLFINTLEKGSSTEILKQVNEYIKANKYTFNVLIDERKPDNMNRFKAEELYKITAIPLKIVIDKAGKIRYRTSGYAGSDEQVVAELSELIDSVK